MPFALWGVRLVAVATGYALSDVKNFFTSGNEQISTAVSHTIILFFGLALGLISYLFFFKK